MKNILPKSIAFISLIIILQLVIFYANLYLDFPELRQLNQHLENNVDMLFFGDSVMDAYEDGEEDQRPFPEWLEQELPDLDIGPVHHPAYHTEVYIEYCKYIIQKENKPKAILIPINMRSFSSDWHGRPEYEFGKKIKYLHSNFLSAFQDPVNVFTKKEVSNSFEEYTQTAVFNRNTKMGLVKDYIGEKYRTITDENTRKKIMFHYLYPLSSEHPKLQAIIQISDILSDHNIQPIFYITPLDYEFCSQYFPNEFTQHVKKNIATIRQKLKNKNAKLYDFSTILNTNEFSWRQDKYPNEHLNQKGKAKLAKRLGEEIDELKL